jgi:hypothetical protein
LKHGCGSSFQSLVNTVIKLKPGQNAWRDRSVDATGNHQVLASEGDVSAQA